VQLYRLSLLIKTEEGNEKPTGPKDSRLGIVINTKESLLHPGIKRFPVQNVVDSKRSQEFSKIYQYQPIKHQIEHSLFAAKFVCVASFRKANHIRFGF
jgi:hypothetical protein